MVRSAFLTLFAFVLAFGPSIGAAYQNYAVLSHLVEHKGEVKNGSSILHSHHHHHDHQHSHTHKEQKLSDSAEKVDAPSVTVSSQGSRSKSEPMHSHSLSDTCSNLAYDGRVGLRLSTPAYKKFKFATQDFSIRSHILSSLFRPPISA